MCASPHFHFDFLSGLHSLWAVELATFWALFCTVILFINVRQRIEKDAVRVDKPRKTIHLRGEEASRQQQQLEQSQRTHQKGHQYEQQKYFEADGDGASYMTSVPMQEGGVHVAAHARVLI